MTDFCEYALQNNIKFDFASATGYFDMVSDPNYELRTFNKVMKKGGILMVDLPNFNSVCHDMIRYFPDQSIRHLNATQTSSYTYKSLSLLLKQNGYKIIKRWAYGIDFYMIMNVLNQYNKNFYKTNAMKVMTKNFLKFQKFLIVTLRQSIRLMRKNLKVFYIFNSKCRFSPNIFISVFFDKIKNSSLEIFKNFIVLFKSVSSSRQIL